MIRIAFLLITALIFSSCSKVDVKKTNEMNEAKKINKIDKETYQSESCNERIRFIILHYTAIDREISIRALTKGPVSAHYLVTDEKNDPVYNLVPLNKRAWHAGVSEFAGRTNLNDSSIGIEIVNLGYKNTIINLKTKNELRNIGNREYFSYTEDQIEKIGSLVQELVKRYDIDPRNVLGHSDIAPTRKQDPGPEFPWKRLYDEYGVGAWYEQNDYNFFYNRNLYKTYSIGELQIELRRYGYGINISGRLDGETIKTIGAFQAHFRPKKVSGQMDLETFAILKALNKKYN